MNLPSYTAVKQRVRRWREPSARHTDAAELRRAVLRLALPAAGEQMLSMLVGIVDTFLVGHLSKAALAGVGLANQWVMMTYTLFGAIGTGSTALIARSTGAGDMPTANRAMRQSIFIGALIGVAAGALAFFFARDLVALMGAEPEALELGTLYLRIASLVFPFSTVMFIGNASLRGAGDTRTPLIVMLVVNTLNSVVAAILVNGFFGLPALGVAGSAIGAVSGRLVGGVLVVGLLMKGRSGLRLSLRRFRLDPEIIQRVLRVGLPGGVEQLVFRIGMMGFSRIIASLGTTAYAAHQVAINAESLSFMPGFGFAVAATTLVGQGLGAQAPEEAERRGYTAYRIGGGLMTLMGLCFVAFAPWFIAFFTNDPDVIATGAGPLRLVGIAQPFLAAAMIFAGALRGAGDTRTPMLITTLGVWGIRLPLAYLFTEVLNWGLTGAWLAMISDLTTRGILNFFRFRSGKWKEIKV